MDFNDTQEEAAFRAEAAAWLKDNVPSQDELAGLDDIAAAKLWQKRNTTQGGMYPLGKKYGGREASAIEQVIWNQEEAKFNTPGGVFVIGKAWLLRPYDMGEDLSTTSGFLPKLASGEEIWCQLFSGACGVRTWQPCALRQSAMAMTG